MERGARGTRQLNVLGLPVCILKYSCIFNILTAPDPVASCSFTTTNTLFTHLQVNRKRKLSDVRDAKGSKNDLHLILATVSFHAIGCIMLKSLCVARGLPVFT